MGGTERLTEQEIRDNLCHRFAPHGNIPTLEQLKEGKKTIMCQSPTDGIQIFQVRSEEDLSRGFQIITCRCSITDWQERSMFIGQDGQLLSSEEMRERKGLNPLPR